MRALAGVMKLVNIADLKSAAFGLTGSSPVPGTSHASVSLKARAELYVSALVLGQPLAGIR